METRSLENQQIFNEAAEWFVEFREDEVAPQLRTEFNRWVRQSPDHIRAYLEVAAFWADVPHLVAKDAVDADALIAYARGERNVVELNASQKSRTASPRTEPPPISKFLGGRRSGWNAAALAIVGILSVSVIHSILQSGVYATDVGEQRSIILEDGSNVELNARSRIRVRFASRERIVELLEGEAFFHVASDPTRPFTVSSGDTHVRAVGTQFDVYRKDSGTAVSVVEGRVAILVNQQIAITGKAPVRELADFGNPQLTQGEASTKLLLSAGEQIIVTAQAAVRPAEADVIAATAWTQRQIVFHGSSLSEVCEQFNRYNRKQLVVDDPELRGVRVSGVFSTTDPTALLRFLHERIQLITTEKNGRILISRK
jgi:transmembrane sensor